MRDDVVAVVFADAGTASGRISLSYPGEVSWSQVEQDLAAMQEVTDWRFSPPGVTAVPDETQAVSAMRPGAHVGSSYGHPIWPVVWALKRYNRITVMVIGDRYKGATGRVENRFVHGTWSGGGAIWCYDVRLKDRTFGSIAELKAEEPRGSAEQTPAHKSLQTAGGWYILVGIALVLGVLTYIVAARLTRSKRASRRRAKAEVDVRRGE